MLIVKALLLKYEKNDVAASWAEASCWAFLFILLMSIKIMKVDKAYGFVPTNTTEALHFVLHSIAFLLSYGLDHTPIHGPVGSAHLNSAIIAHTLGFIIEVVGSLMLQKFYKTDANIDVADAYC